MSTKSLIYIVALGLVGAGLAFRPASAATPAASFGVTATVQATCVVSKSAMPITVHTGWSGTVAVSVACNHSVAYSVGFKGKRAFGGTLATPGISRPYSASLNDAQVTNFLEIVDLGRTADPGSVAYMDIGPSRAFAGNAQSPASQYLAAGAFADLITVAVTF